MPELASESVLYEGLEDEIYLLTITEKNPKATTIMNRMDIEKMVAKISDLST